MDPLKLKAKQQEELISPAKKLSFHFFYQVDKPRQPIFLVLYLNVYGIPEFTTAARAVIPTDQNAVEAVASILQAGIPIARVELVDEESIRQVNHFSDTNYAERPTLFLEFDGFGAPQIICVISSPTSTWQIFNLSASGCFTQSFT